MRDPGLGEGVAWEAVRAHSGRPSPTHWLQVQSRLGTWAPPGTTRYSPDSDPGSLSVAWASAFSADQAGGWGRVGKRGLEFI